VYVCVCVWVGVGVCVCVCMLVCLWVGVVSRGKEGEHMNKVQSASKLNISIRLIVTDHWNKISRIHHTSIWRNELI
jgi:hypothetical protein